MVTEPGRDSPSDWRRLAISDGEFRQLRDFITAHTGIALSDHKRALICARLARRLRQWGLKSYGEYYTLLTTADPEGAELRQMINAITTNKTDFFRESHHFRFLSEQFFPEMRAARRRHVRIWSAGTSSGEEAYSLAITAYESCLTPADTDIRILATDIDTEMLERAAHGVYPEEQLASVSPALLARHFLKGTGANEGLMRVKPHLQSCIRFHRFNLIEKSWPMRDPFDAIFCRNVLIYFDKALQRELLARFAAFLRPGGYLMLGHAEAIHGFDGLFRIAGHSIYRLRGEAP
jgi:chemotaxis protein methyltransferase CheR